MFIDTHCHLDMVTAKKYGDPVTDETMQAVSQVLQDAESAGVTRIINISCDIATSHNSVRFAKAFDNVFATVGLHPCDTSEQWRDDFKIITELTQNSAANGIVGIGEVGLDYFHKPFFESRQKDAFKAHLDLACEHNLPVSVHIRDAVDDALKILESYRGDVRGILHCFMYELSIAKEVADWGLLMGIGGPVSYPKNDFLREVVTKMPLESIVLETDAPFLPPQPLRGKRNSPAQIAWIAQFIADLRGISAEEVGKVTTQNAVDLFSLDSDASGR